MRKREQTGIGKRMIKSDEKWEGRRRGLRRREEEEEDGWRFIVI